MRLQDSFSLAINSAEKSGQSAKAAKIEESYEKLGAAGGSFRRSRHQAH